jgi:hypothetical protein
VGDFIRLRNAESDTVYLRKDAIEQVTSGDELLVYLRGRTTPVSIANESSSDLIGFVSDNAQPAKRKVVPASKMQDAARPRE